MKTLSTMILMMLILQGSACAYDASDNSDRLSGASSSVFSPGYINAAKQKTEAIIGQLDPKKSFMERLVENIKGGVANNVDEAADTKVVAEVKKKTSAKSAAAQSGDAAVVIPVNPNSDEIPAYIRDEIQEYIGAHNNEYPIDYTLKQSNGKYYAFWNDSNSTIKTQIFDSNGIAISETPTSITGGRLLNFSSINNVSVLPNGNVAVFWIEQDLNNNHSIKTQTFDSNGIAISETPTSITADRLLIGSSISNVAVLPNGNVSVFWQESYLDGWYTIYSIKTQIFDSNGIAISGTPTSIMGDKILKNAGIHNVSVLPNGNLAVFWTERDLNEKYSLKTQIFDSNGVAISGTPTIIMGDKILKNAGIKNVSVLPNGNVAVFWQEKDLNNKYSLKTQTFDSNGVAISETPTILTGNRLLTSVSISNVFVLPNGNVAVFWYEKDLNYNYSIKTQTFNSNGIATSETPIILTGERLLCDVYTYISKVSVLPNGNIIVFWVEFDLNNKYSLKTQTFDSNGVAISGTLTSLTEGNGLYNAAIHISSVLPNGNLAVFWVAQDSLYNHSIKTQIFNQNGVAISGTPTIIMGDKVLRMARIDNIYVLANGNVAVFWYERDLNGIYSIKTQTFDSSGIAIPGTPTSLTGDRVLNYASMNNVSILANGNVAVSWQEMDLNNKYSFKTQALGVDGHVVSNKTLRPSTTPLSTGNLSQNLLPDTFLNSLKSNILKNSSYGFEIRSTLNNSSNNAVPEIFKSLLSSKDALATNMGKPMNEAELDRLITEAFSSAIIVPSLRGAYDSMPEMQVALALANILKNPTEDQKLVIDAITSLLKSISEIEGEAGKPDELTKTENDLLQMAAAVLLTQGIPDLLKEGDMENMKGMFKDLGASKDKVLLDYKNSIKPYYNNIAKEIAANIAVLEIKGIVNKKLTEEELRKMEPREIDKILANIRKNNDKSFELEYILQQDSKYRKEYLDPSKKLMEDHMKLILGTFTKRLSEALEEKK